MPQQSVVAAGSDALSGACIEPRHIAVVAGSRVVRRARAVREILCCPDDGGRPAVSDLEPAASTLADAPRALSRSAGRNPRVLPRAVLERDPWLGVVRVPVGTC